jgi:hypothetical protein
VRPCCVCRNVVGEKALKEWDNRVAQAALALFAEHASTLLYKHNGYLVGRAWPA